MENQHRKISGYRELSEEEIELMNKIKALGPQIEEVVESLNKHLATQFTQAYNSGMSNCVETAERHEYSTPFRFIEEGKTSLQVGLMLLTRAVAQPTFF